ncbi:MAG: LysM peptidoglycan-binding domain-containing protein [Desulfobacterales bacterium]
MSIFEEIDMAKKVRGCYGWIMIWIQYNFKKCAPAIYALFTILMVSGDCFPMDYDAYVYTVRSGDTLSEITLSYTGNLNYFRVAESNNISNPDLIYPDDTIILSAVKPVATLQKYLHAIYNSHPREAYDLLSTETRRKYSFLQFKRSVHPMTVYDLDSIIICSDFLLHRQHILQLKIFLLEDAASWGFNLVREKYKWYILLFDLNPTAPRDNGYIEWRCNGS